MGACEEVVGVGVPFIKVTFFVVHVRNDLLNVLLVTPLLNFFLLFILSFFWGNRLGDHGMFHQNVGDGFLNILGGLVFLGLV